MSKISDYPLLDSIDTPQQLRLLRKEQLPDLADELRRFLIEVTSRTGGHLAPGLGALELTLALHYVFNTPEDRLVWDIGHQAYPHKIITGRRDQFETIRQFGGLSGFLKRTESEFDTFGAGHASTSISAALGMAVAAGVQGEKRQVVAIIGDGALTGGMAYEALNNAGDIGADLLVVLNDNEMSISPNVGAVSNYLARILSGRAYTTVRESKTVLGTLPPPLLRYARRCEEHIKGMMMPSTLFEELGFYYIGPVDGHDLKSLVGTLENMRKLDGPRFLHIVTQKGKGFQPAEGDPCVYHGVSPFNPDTGKLEARPNKARTFTQVFGDWLCDMAHKDSRLVGITPAMREGSGLVRFSKEYPDRYFDVGIAEQHALTFAAGLACEGLKPVVAIYSTFLQRAYDQLIHDISIQDLDVLFAIDRAGFVGADGATHAGTYDFSYLRCIPNMLIMAPADEAECRQMLYTGFIHPGPAAVRYPRGSGVGTLEAADMAALTIGQGQLRKEGKEIAILSFGTMLATCLEAADTLDATVANMRFVKPLDRDLILSLADSHSCLVTVEDNVIAGGAGSAVNELLLAERRQVDIINLGAPDRHMDQGSQSQQLAACGLDAPGIVARIRGGVGTPDPS